MAVYFLRSKHISRSNGSRVTRAAAYRAGELIRNEATSEIFDYTPRHDVTHKEIILPADLADRGDMAWSRERSTLWNAAEHAGLRCNSRLAREWLVFLPPELDPDQRRQLVQAFAHELADRYRAAVDLCVHQPRPGADPRNHHAHLLMTIREVTPNGFGARTQLEVSGRQRFQMGMPGSSRDEYLGLRSRWAHLTNAALEQAGLSERIDHRSYKDRGINREPTLSIPEKVWYAERAGRHSTAGDEIRARHRERLEARNAGPDALAKVIEKQRAEMKAGIEQKATSPKKRTFGSLTREERNAYRREHYRKSRELNPPSPADIEKRRAASLRAYYAQRQKNPEVIRQARRRYWAENAEEMKRKQREYRHKIADTLNARRRAQRKAKAIDLPGAGSARTKNANDGAKAAAQRWKAWRAQQGPDGTAKESAQRWQKYREAQERLESTGKSPQQPQQHERSRRRDHDLER